MILVEPNAEYIQQKPYEDGIYKQIELCGRTCYKSMDKMTQDSAKPFVDRMIKSNHTAMLEHGTVYLEITGPWNVLDYNDAGKYVNNKYSKVVGPIYDKDHYEQGERAYSTAYITTNLRVLVENGWLDDLKYVCYPTDDHEKRYTFKLTTDRGVSHELVRHRVFSFAQESTRYCNYSKDKFGGEISYIMPSWFPEANVQQQEAFMQISKATEDYYFALLGVWDERKPDKRFKTGFKNNPLTPQQARQVLPNSLKTEICMTGFASDWKFFFDLRLFGKTGAPHPDMKLLAQLMKEEAERCGIWYDIENCKSKFDLCFTH
jgi:thymidylate synthase (FAD)